MNFFTLNKKWLDNIFLKHNKVFDEKVIQEINNFLDNHNASFPLVPIPLILEKNNYDELCKAGNHLINIQTKLFSILLKEYTKLEILKVFNLSPTLSTFINWSKLEDSSQIIGRFDIVPTNNGYQFCELNIDTAIGGTQIFNALNIYNKIFSFSLFDKQLSPEQYIAKYIKRVVQKYNLNRVVIFSLKWYIAQKSKTIEILYETIKKSLPEIEVLLVDEKNYLEELLKKEEGRRTLVYRMAIYRDIQNDKLLEKILKSGVKMINMFETEIRSNKKWFAIFHDLKYQKFLSKEEKSIIKKYVPSTFYLTKDNMEYYLDNKDKYVFKKNMSYRGIDVLIGKENDKEILYSKLRNNKNDWVVQSLIPTETLSLPINKNFSTKEHKIVLSLFLVCGKNSGMLVRASSQTGVVTVTNGGAKMSWAYPVLSTKVL